MKKRRFGQETVGSWIEVLSFKKVIKKDHWPLNDRIRSKYKRLVCIGGVPPRGCHESPPLPLFKLHCTPYDLPPPNQPVKEARSSVCGCVSIKKKARKK